MGPALRSLHTCLSWTGLVCAACLPVSAEGRQWSSACCLYTGITPHTNNLHWAHRMLELHQGSCQAPVPLWRGCCEATLIPETYCRVPNP